MNKILAGVIIGAAIAGVVYYMYNQEEVDEQLGNLKDKASDALDKLKNKYGKQAEDVNDFVRS